MFRERERERERERTRYWVRLRKMERDFLCVFVFVYDEKVQENLGYYKCFLIF